LEFDIGFLLDVNFLNPPGSVCGLQDRDCLPAPNPRFR
jgi:hypothetical protein